MNKSKMTKIICSIGPATNNYETFSSLVRAGMNVARINFSHANLEERKIVEDLVDEVNSKMGTFVAKLYDTKGPDLRTCNFENDLIELVAGKTIRIVKEDVLGTDERITFNFRDVIDNIEVGHRILLDDGLIRLDVIAKDEEGLTCEILDSAKIKSRRGVNIPGVKLDMPYISEEDIEDIKYACSHDGDYLGISFVSTKEDILEVRKLLKEFGKEDMKIITKVETSRAIDNLDEIIDATDGVMVARGDLGVEVPMHMIPILQKKMIRKCREKGKICIVATEMLASMYTSSRPTRAELTDIANAVFDGADAVMLSGETTIGKFPVDAVTYMAEICKTAEENINFRGEFFTDISNNIADTITTCAVDSADMLDAKLIVTPTMSGYTAKTISNLKPSCRILAPCTSEKVAKRLALNWGVYPTLVNEYKTTDEVVNDALKEVGKFTELKEDDIIVVTGGFPNNGLKQTNFLKIEKIK